MTSQVEGADTANVSGDGLDVLRTELRAKKVFYIVDLCVEYDEDNILKELVEWRRIDILQLIDEINDEPSNKHQISVSKKNKFCKIISQYAQTHDVNNLDDEDLNKHVLLDKEERESIIKLSQRQKSIHSSINTVSNAMQNVSETMRKLEKEIDEIFQEQINALNQRKKQILQELHIIGANKTNVLNEQELTLKNKVNEAEKLHKKMNILIKKPISLEEVEERKKSILKQCDQQLNDEFSSNPNTTANITFSADSQSMKSMIKTFGRFIGFEAPILLCVEKGNNNKEIVIKWTFNQDLDATNINIEWILQSDDDDKKQATDWKTKTVSALSKTATIMVQSAGLYKIRISTENDIKSDIKTIKITSNDLIIRESEIKVLNSDKTHVFDSIIIGKNAQLTVHSWNGSKGGKLLLQSHTIKLNPYANINMNGKGYKGGKAQKQQNTGKAYQGQSFQGQSTQDCKANFGGGGGGWGQGGVGGAGGGGAGYGSAGNDSHPNTHKGKKVGGCGGEIYGDHKLSELYLGSGGGSGHPYGHSGCGKEGGNGGGIIYITCSCLEIGKNASISANGMNAPSVNNAAHQSGGGGGSGGSIWIKAQQIKNDGSIVSVGGKGAEKAGGIWCSSGGDGGDGRIRVDCRNISGVINIKPSPYRG